VPRYWLDANVFIEAKNGPYAFDLAPGFWIALEASVQQGNLCSPMMVYDELADFDDELSEWAKKMKAAGLFVDPGEAVQALLREVADHVRATYQMAESASFLGKADPWLVAHAKFCGTTVVTREKLVGSNSLKAKIPNICAKFGVRSIDTFEMLRELKVSLK
jgi:hypothetical protein